MVTVTQQRLNESLNIWINWSLLAVYGKMAEADHLMRSFPDAVEAGAAEMMRRTPVDISRELYRGIAINDRYIKDGILPHEEALTFTSFTEKLPVACWFANPDSEMNRYVKELDSTAKGYIAIHRPRGEGDVLFHYWWGQELKLWKMAAMHPEIQDAPQFRWNLNTQFEVILKPVQKLAVLPISEFGCLPVEELDQMYTYPFALD